MNGLASLSGLRPRADRRIVIGRDPKIVDAPAGFYLLLRKGSNCVIRMNCEGIAAYINVRRSRILPNRKVEICHHTLVDWHTKDSLFGPLQDEWTHRNVPESARLSQDSGIH